MATICLKWSRNSLVDWLEVVWLGFMGFLGFVIIVMVAALIHMAIYDHLELENCKPLNDKESICYYSSFNNSTKVTTKIIPNA